MKISNFFRAMVAASALFVGLTQAAHAKLTVYTGDTTGATTTYNRPTEALGGLSTFGTDVIYNALKINVTTTGDYAFLVHGDQFDTFAVLYEGAFNPNDALANAIGASDDLVSATTSGFSSPLTAGVSYYLVVSGFYNGDAGEYVVTIDGPSRATVSPVPEPSAWLMLAFGLAAVTYAQRRKSQR